MVHAKVTPETWDTYYSTPEITKRFSAELSIALGSNKDVDKMADQILENLPWNIWDAIHRKCAKEQVHGRV